MELRTYNVITFLFSILVIVVCWIFGFIMILQETKLTPFYILLVLFSGIGYGYLFAQSIDSKKD